MPIPIFLMSVWSCLKHAWLWIKKYWMWLLLPIGLIVFLAGRLTGRKKPDVLAPELIGAADTKVQEDEKAAQAKEEAKAKFIERVAEVKREHAETIEKLDGKQKELVEELSEDPEALNTFLKRVGEEVRDG